MTYTYPTGRTAQEVYEDLHRRGYGKTNHGMGTQPLCRGAESVLDVGCGLSAYLWQLREWFGVDGCCGVDITGESAIAQRIRGIVGTIRDVGADGLIQQDKSVQIITCFDVLEHLPPESLDFVLAEFCRVARDGFIVTVGTHESVARGNQDEPLHLTIKPLAWWEEKLEGLCKCANCTYDGSVKPAFSRVCCPICGARTPRLRKVTARRQRPNGGWKEQVAFVVVFNEDSTLATAEPLTEAEVIELARRTP